VTVHQIVKMNGIAASPGIIIGKARLVDRSKTKILYQYLINDEQINREVERFTEALNAAKEQIITLKNRMSDQIKAHAYVLDAHIMIMNDGMLSDATTKTILDERINAEWALKKSIQKIRLLFEQIDDEYIRDRMNDAEYVAERIFRNLAGKEQESLAEINERVIIVAHDLSPADTSEMNIDKIMGFITDVGGKTSHTAIMAQALKIPAVVGLESVTSQIQDGNLLIVDGNDGEIVITPDDETIIFYQEKHDKHKRYQSSILRDSHLPAITADGHRIAIKANIEFFEEVDVAREHGAEGIGLYRTEILYLRSKGLPSEEDMFNDYKTLAKTIAPASVTIRTLDLGGDKSSSDMESSSEVNPALGLRAIRYCLREPDFFKNQLRAILRASAFGDVRLMFPMISGLQEVLDVKRILKEAMSELDKKNITYKQNIKVGIMIEVPSAVAVSDILAGHVDFFSIGTNDLIQYALAVDRVNEHVAYMYQPFHPAILRMIRQVVQAAKYAGIEVTLCGEMAGDPLCARILVGLGIDELSMNTLGVPIIKKIVRSISLEDARSDVKEIFKLDTANQVREFMKNKVVPLNKA